MQVCSIICCQAWEYTLVEINALGNWQRWRRWPTLSVLRAVWGSNDPRAYSIPDYHSRQCTFLFFIAVMSLAWILTVFFLCVEINRSIKVCYWEWWNVEAHDKTWSSSSLNSSIEATNKLRNGQWRNL